MTVAVMQAFGAVFQGGFEVLVLQELKDASAGVRKSIGRRWLVADPRTGVQYVAMADELRVWFVRPLAANTEAGAL